MMEAGRKLRRRAALDRWVAHHVAVRRQGAAWTLWLDGVEEENSLAMPTGPLSTGQALHIVDDLVMTLSRAFGELVHQRALDNVVTGDHFNLGAFVLNQIEHHAAAALRRPAVNWPTLAPDQSGYLGGAAPTTPATAPSAVSRRRRRSPTTPSRSAATGGRFVGGGRGLSGRIACVDGFPSGLAALAGHSVSAGLHREELVEDG